ncbi:MAG: hypothetical protein ACI4LX_05060 [Treponema sp.]
MKRLFLKFCFSLLVLFLFAGCVSGNGSGFVYSIKNCEIKNCGIEFSVKNMSLKKIKSFKVHAELNADDFSDEFSARHQIEKEFSSEIESKETADFSIDITELAAQITTLLENSDDFDLETGIYVNRIFLTEIKYEDNQVWTDKYGTFCF